MPAPAGTSTLPVLLSATAALALLSPCVFAAPENGTEVTRTIQAGLPHYDPSAHEKDPVTKDTKVAPKDTSSATTQTATTGTPSADAIALPKITVHPDLVVPKPRPRLTVTPPVHDLKSEPMESEAGRDARLVQKHLTKLDQALNSGKSNLTRAKDAEHVESRAKQLNDLADAVDTATLGEQDPKLTKKIRDEFEKLSNTSPK